MPPDVSSLSGLSEQQLHELAELMEALLTASLSRLNREWESTLDSKLESKLKPIRTDLAAVKHSLKHGLARLV
jgi:hypothetical protein